MVIWMISVMVESVPVQILVLEVLHPIHAMLDTNWLELAVDSADQMQPGLEANQDVSVSLKNLRSPIMLTISIYLIQ